MKSLVLIGALLFCVFGCAPKPADLKSFYAFRKQVANELSATCDCGPIHRDPISGWLFDIQPRQQREFSIRVWKCDFLTQEQWDRNCDADTNQVFDIMNPPNLTREQVARQVAAERWSLPLGSYDSIGISVELQWPEVATVELEPDRKEVVQYIDQIEQMLKLYQRPLKNLENGR